MMLGTSHFVANMLSKALPLQMLSWASSSLTWNVILTFSFRAAKPCFLIERQVPRGWFPCLALVWSLGQVDGLIY